ADVEGDDMRRAAAEQDVRKTACGRADVERGASVRVDSEGVQCVGELYPPASDIRVVRFNERELRVGCDRMAGFRDGFAVHPDLAREDHRAGALARGDEAAFDEEKIEA